jgi:TolB-like protein/DNA-binding winged helix-turn-helix (wHTH) protein
MPPPNIPGNGPAPARYRIADLEVDIGKAEVTRAGEGIALPKLSFDLLYTLIQAAPAIVTNDQLLERVWPGLHVSPESVAQRVKLLRSALGDHSQQPRYILGVRGRGYRLVPMPERISESPLPSVDEDDFKSAPQVPNIEGNAGEPPTSIRSQSSFRRAIVIAAVLLALVASTAAWFLRSSTHSAQPGVAITDRSVAVLPFVDMSEKKDQEYFADGMAEEIIDLLVKIPGLRVVGRTSSFQFKGKNEDARTIAKQLGVTYVLEGSVRKSGERMRVTAQLIDSRNGTPRWSQTYDRDFSEVLKLQDEIAIRVVREVENDAAFSFIVSRETLRNPEAYAAFLHGMDTVDSDQQASYFQRALDLDPSFADAATALASNYLFRGQSGSMPAAEAFEKARNFAQLALKIDPNQSDAHEVLGDIHLDYDWDWPAVEREYHLADSLAFRGLGSTQGDSPQLSLALGRWDDALRIANKAVTDDPLDPQSFLWLGVVELRRGRLGEAEGAMRRSLDLNPEFRFSHYILAVILLGRGQPDAALAESLKEPIQAYSLVGSSMANFALGRKAESDASLAQLLRIYAPYIPSGIAAVYAFRGESDDAFKWLDEAYARKDPLLYRIKFTPEYDKLHDDPKYKAFLRKMNLPAE